MFLPGEALIHWPQKLTYHEPMTVTLPSQKNVRNVKTLHLVADARISTCAVLTGNKTPSRNVRIYLRSAMCQLFGLLIDIGQMLWQLCTGYATCMALSKLLPAGIACAACKPCIIAQHPIGIGNLSCHQLRSVVVRFLAAPSGCSQQLCIRRGQAVLCFIASLAATSCCARRL